MATKKVPSKTTTNAAAKKTSAVTAKKTSSINKMTRTALIQFMSEKIEVSRKQAAEFLDLLAATAIQETKKNGEFSIPGIGKLVKAQRAARLGRNPQTGETIKIKAKTAVKFRVAKASKDLIAPTK